MLRLSTFNANILPGVANPFVLPPTFRAGGICWRLRGLAGESWRICGGLLWLFALRTFIMVWFLLQGLLRVLPLRCLSSLISLRPLDRQLLITFFYYTALMSHSSLSPIGPSMPKYRLAVLLHTSCISITCQGFTDTVWKTYTALQTLPCIQQCSYLLGRASETPSPSHSSQISGSTSHKKPPWRHPR